MATNPFFDPDLLSQVLFEVSLVLNGWYDELLVSEEEETPASTGAAQKGDLEYLRRQWKEYYELEDEILLLKVGTVEDLWPR